MAHKGAAHVQEAMSRMAPLGDVGSSHGPMAKLSVSRKGVRAAGAGEDVTSNGLGVNGVGTWCCSGSGPMTMAGGGGVWCVGGARAAPPDLSATAGTGDEVNKKHRRHITDAQAGVCIAKGGLNPDRSGVHVAVGDGRDGPYSGGLLGDDGWRSCEVRER